MDETNFYAEMISAFDRHLIAIDEKEFDDSIINFRAALRYAEMAVAQDTNRIANELVTLNHWASRIANSLELLVGIQRSRR